MTENGTRVVHISTRHLRHGGAERNTRFTMRFQAEEGAEVTLVTGPNSETDYLSGEPFSVYESNFLINRVDPVKDVRIINELTGLFDRLQPDIVHTHQGKAGLVGRIGAIMADVPCIVYGLHGDHVAHPDLNVLTRPIYRSFEQVLGRQTDYFVSVGHEIKQRYLNRGIGHEKQHVVIPSGMNMDDFKNRSFSSDEDRKEKKRQLGVDDPDVPIVGMVARLAPRKGYDDAVQIARKVIENKHIPDVTFLFVGSGPLREDLEQRVTEEGLDDDIIFTGYREDIAAVMACFDVFMFTSHMEGLPQVLVQAAATGLPIVTFAVEGAREVVLDQTSGYVLDQRHQSEMVTKIEVLLTDSSLRKRFGRRATRHVGNHWSIDVMRAKVKQFYDRVTANLDHFSPP